MNQYRGPTHPPFKSVVTLVRRLNRWGYAGVGTVFHELNPRLNIIAANPLNLTLSDGVHFFTSVERARCAPCGGVVKAAEMWFNFPQVAVRRKVPLLGS